MLNKNEDKLCFDDKCMYNNPYHREHYHVRTIHGEYVKFIVDKPKIKEI